MADVATCSRCKNHAPGLPRAPLPGPAGQAILANVCASCWKEWLGMQVKYINEYRLNPMDPRHFEFLLQQATAFLGLPGAGPQVPDPGTPS